MKRYLADINFWFALAVEDHPHHAAAIRWWNHNQFIVGFVHATQFGLLRLLTTSATMGGKPLRNDAAWRVFDEFVRDGRVRSFAEVAAIEEEFRKLSSLPHSSPKVWMDAYLASIAKCNEAVIVTFDKAFANYGGECVILEA